VDFGLLLLIVPLAIGALIWASDATDYSVPKGEPKSGTFFMFLIVIIVIGLIGFLSLGFGSGR
jgi:ABC-type transport system involved in cytochrome c biogenesis permease component